MQNDLQQLLHIIAQSPQGIAVYDSAALNIRFVNPEMLAVWDRSDAIVGQTFGEVLPEFTEQGFTDLLLDVWHSGTSYRATDYPADIRKGGRVETKYFDFEYKAVLNKQGDTVAILHTSTDVTKRKKALEKVEEQEALLTFNKELEALTHTLSHDLRNPLGVAKMGSQFMRSKVNMPSADIHKWCDAILAAISSMEGIINHTLRLNQVRTLEPSNSRIAMPELIEQVCEEARKLLENENATFQIAELLPLYGDKSLISQLFFSVIGNAIRYSSNSSQPHIEIESMATAGHIVYSIRDNGIGIVQNELPLLFDLFYRGSNAQEFAGTGVGLSLASKILKRLRGEIAIESRLNEGTTVRLTFPAENTDATTDK